MQSPSQSPNQPPHLAQNPTPNPSPTFSSGLVDWLARAGVRFAFGVSGGGIAFAWSALCNDTRLRTIHCLHESGAAFAAAEAYFATNTPTVLFTTTGPGLTNALTGILAARSEGAKMIIVSGVSPTQRRGKGATQETDPNHPLPGLFAPNNAFDFAAVIESESMLHPALHAISAGLSRPGPFVAHLGLPADLQGSPLESPVRVAPISHAQTSATPDHIRRIASRLVSHSFAIWLGFDARFAAPQIARFVARSGAKVMCSPRAKGIFPEDHHLFLGVTGFAGHDGPLRFIEEHGVDFLLVLGSRLGEGASQWSNSLKPRRGLIHVHPSADAFGGPFSDVSTTAVTSEVATFIELLSSYWPKNERQEQDYTNNIANFSQRPRSSPLAQMRPGPAPVRPSILMRAIQYTIVDHSDAVVMAESGNSFAWAIQLLQFRTPGRWRTSVAWGAMGHCAAGVIGAAIGSNKRAVAIVGDGSMLMQNELATAVYHQVPALWIVLNDGCYNMCRQGTSMSGISGVDCNITPIDFAAMARSVGALGVRVEHEVQLMAALHTVMQSSGPAVLDVVIDASEMAPIARRIQSLTWHDKK